MGILRSSRIIMTPLKRVAVEGGDVLHVLKCTEGEFRRFGEAYFSKIAWKKVKAWKRHQRMTLNLVVPMGQVLFVFLEEEKEKPLVESIGDYNYVRLTVPPGIWFGFQGLAKPYSLILNIADILHDPMEVERKDISAFAYDWELQL